MYVAELEVSFLQFGEINPEVCGRIEYQQSNEKATVEIPKYFQTCVRGIGFPKLTKVEGTTNVVGWKINIKGSQEVSVESQVVNVVGIELLLVCGLASQ